MFERFTDDARSVVSLASGQATRLGHHWLGCEHMLMALASLDDPVGETLRDAGVTAAKIESTILRQVGPGHRLFDKLDRDALATIGIDVEEVRKAVEHSFGPGALDRTRPPRQPTHRFRPWRRHRRHDRGHIGMTRCAKECLEGAVKGVLRAKTGYVGTEHIAKSILATKHSSVPNILAALGVSPTAIRTDIASKYREAS